MIGNVKGDDFLLGFAETIPSSATEIIPFFRPNPPIPFLEFHYCYLVYRQTYGYINYSSASKETTKWDQSAFANKYNLELLTSNYFVAQATLWSSFMFFFSLIFSIFTGESPLPE
tara:strand:- start:94 stop:438 length:345 start_codon:yes stop_codon:yes gene_type:complete